VEIPCSSCSVHKQAICAGLAEEEIGEFGRNVRIRRVKAGQSVYREFEEAKYIFTIVTGEIRLANLLDDGRRQVTAFKSAGEIIGENQNGHYQSDAEAVCDTFVCQIPIKVLNQHIDGNPVMRDALMEMIRKELSALRQHAVLLGRKTPVEKIASFLLDRVDRSAVGNEKAIEIILPMGRSDIADYLGLTIETVSRTITKLKNLEVIAVPTTHSILIINRQELESLAEGEQ
jgi:CRP/FNR family transcriptional regulator|tara:strand:+ start:673 stop:1365 length:693 start_codon:yes stop_codon:yes gene_type:complete